MNWNEKRPAQSEQPSAIVAELMVPGMNEVITPALPYNQYAKFSITYVRCRT
jgi:hypothetical protein